MPSYKGAGQFNTPAGKPLMGPFKPDMPNYTDKGQPTGGSTFGRWGELRYNPAPGKDRWGGTEIPGLKYSGGTKDMNDYQHQMKEQPSKPSGNLSIPKENNYKPVGSGASAWVGGSLGGGGGAMGRK